MKSTLRLTLVFLFLVNAQLLMSQIAVNSDGSDPDASAMLEVSSSDKGILIPRMITAQRTAIASPATSLLVYDTDEGTYWYYENNQWNEIAVGSDLSTITQIQEPTHSSTIDIGDKPIEMVEQNGYLYIYWNEMMTNYAS